MMDRDRKENLFFLFVIAAVTVMAYAPMVEGILRLSTRTTQAVNAFVLVAMAFADAVATMIRGHTLRLRINHHGLALFSLSCVALVVASFARLWPLSVLGFCLNIGALLSFCFGREGVRAFYPAIGGLGVAVGMLVFVPRLDMALRLVAAKASSWALASAGIRTELAMSQAPFQVAMVVEKGAGLFDVATECNGFGILLSSVVLTVILSIRRRVGPWRVIGLLGFALGVGLVFNILRIVAIVMATVQTDLNYDVIHEGLGTAIYLLALVVVYAGNGLGSGHGGEESPARPSASAQREEGSGLE